VQRSFPAAPSILNRESESSMVQTMAIIGLSIGALMWRDANRLARHVKVAEALMAEGVQEDEAMERSGCNFWDAPWPSRLTKRYPALPGTN